MEQARSSVVQRGTKRHRRAGSRVEHLGLLLRAIRNLDQLATRGKDCGSLLKSACENLVEICGYSSAWAAIIDQTQGVVVAAQAGRGVVSLPIGERLKSSELPACGQKALLQSEVVVTGGWSSACAGCHLWDEYCRGNTMTVRLEYGGRIYGLMCVSIPKNRAANEEEKGLVTEVARDISFALYSIGLNEEHRRAEEALEESEEHYETLMGSLQDAVFEFRGGELVWCNDKVEEIYGYTKKDLIGKNARFFFPKDMDSSEFIKEISAAVNERGLFQGTVVVRKKDGSLADIEYSISRAPSQNPINVIVVARDITARKKVERERERLLIELAEKTKELEQIVYVSSHDLRSPLVNIQGFTRELEHAFKQVYDVLNSQAVSFAVRKRLAPILDEDIPFAFQYILASSSKMDSLLSGLLRLSRLGRAALNIKQLDMNNLMSEVVASFEFQVKEMGAALEVEELPPCMGDETQINQVFSNLLDNALKFLDLSRPGVIKISGNEEKNQVIYGVEDNGIGIGEKDKEAIFEIFRRLNPGDKPGEGLGLTIVRKILDRHGGKIWVESEPGKGSKFLVALPASETEGT